MSTVQKSIAKKNNVVKLDSRKSSSKKMQIQEVESNSKESTSKEEKVNKPYIVGASLEDTKLDNVKAAYQSYKIRAEQTTLKTSLEDKKDIEKLLSEGRKLLHSDSNKKLLITQKRDPLSIARELTTATTEKMWRLAEVLAYIRCNDHLLLGYLEDYYNLHEVPDGERDYNFKSFVELLIPQTGWRHAYDVSGLYVILTNLGVTEERIFRIGLTKLGQLSRVLSKDNLEKC